jgi:hypothetical protein
MTLSARLLATGLLVWASGLASPAADRLPAQPLPTASERCASLAQLARPDLVIESAELAEAAGDRVLPAHCGAMRLTASWRLGATFPGVSRPLCPYPLVARYDGGDPNSADSFTCRT